MAELCAVGVRRALEGPAAVKAREAPAEGFVGLEVWTVDLARCTSALEVMEQVSPHLSHDDLQRAATLADAEAVRQRRAAYIALRLILNRAFGIAVQGVPFERTGTGKPHLPGHAGGFSLSHTHGHALVAVAAEGPIGVDLEWPRDVRVAPERRQRIERAAQSLAPGHPLPDTEDRRFLQAWVRLEAYAKARGSGIGSVLTQIGVAGGRRSLHAEDRLAQFLAEGPAITVADLALHPAVASLAGRPGRVSPAVFPLPATVSGLRSLLI